MTTFDRDDLIRLALTPDSVVRAPSELADDIARAVATTPQRRPFLPGLVAPRWFPTLAPSTMLLLLVGMLVLLGALAVIASRPPATSPSLVIYHGGPDRSGVMPGPGPQGTPVIAWQADLHGQVPVQVMPIVFDGRVYIGDGEGFVSMVDFVTGDLLGSVELDGPVESSPTLVDGLLIVGAGDGSLTALDAVTLQERWQTVPGGPIRASLVAVDGLLFVGSDDGNLYVIDPTTGATRGHHAIGGPVSRGPAISSDTIYVGAEGGTFVAIDRVTGERRWTVDLPPGTTGTPTVAGDTVYVPFGLQTDAGGVVALRTSDGSERWRFTADDGGEAVVGAVGDGSVFVQAKDGFVRALDPATGIERWRYDTGAGIGALAGLADGVLYVTNDGATVHAVEAVTGTGRWVVEVAGIPSMAAVIDGRVIVATSLGKVIALEDPAASSPP